MVFLIIFHRYLSHHDQFLGSNSVGKHRSQMADPYLYLHRFVFRSGISFHCGIKDTTRPAYWFMAIFFVAGFGVYNQLFFMKNRSWVTLTPDTIKRARTSIIVYGFLLLILLVGATLLYLYPTSIMQKCWAVFALLASILMLVWQDIGMKLEKNELGVP